MSIEFKTIVPNKVIIHEHQSRQLVACSQNNYMPIIGFDKLYYWRNVETMADLGGLDYKQMICRHRAEVALLFYASCDMVRSNSYHSKLRFGILWLMVILVMNCDSGVEVRPLDSNTDSACTPPLSDDYILPFPVGAAYELIQGACGSFDHELELRYAFDFAMPIGSVVTAAQDGVVLALEEGFADGENDRFTDNALLIEHENGTVGRYLHLTKDGALVEVGEIVLRGDTIALSGNTGFITTPQLHFDVVRCGSNCSDFNSITIGFLNAEPPLKNENVTYLASPY